MKKQFSELRIQNLILFIIFLPILIVVLTIILRKIIITPLNKLLDVANAIAEGDFTRETGIRQQDEIGRLADAFRNMAVHLQDNFERMQRASDERKQLIDELQEKNVELEAGLINQEKNISLPAKKLEETEKKILALHLKDINDKLSLFDELQQRIETFTGIVSPKLRNKNFRINREQGFVFERGPAQQKGGKLRWIIN